MNEQHRAADVLGLLARMGDSLSNLATGAQATLHSVLHMVTDTMPTSHVLLLEKKDEGYGIAAALGVEEGALPPLSAPRGLLAEADRDRGVVFIRDLERDGRYSPADLLLPAAPARSVVCVPVTKKDLVVGVLYVATLPDERSLAESDVKLLAGIASLLADVLVRSRQYAQMQKLATIDPLTGLLNRSQMDAVLRTEAERARRYKFSLALVMMDLDHFKSVNDTHGHAKGDETLRAFSTILKNGTRRVDYLIRYGGEEFLALLPHIPKENAKIYAERIRRTTSETLHTLAGLPDPRTVSIGIAALPADGETPEGALDAADKALYRAKNGGRDRVELA